MMLRTAVCFVSLVLTAPAWAHDKESPPATGGSGMTMDTAKMGPWTRKPTNESKTRKEVEAFLKEEDAVMKRQDVDAVLARTDFPFFMATDNSKGEPLAETYDRQKYGDMMKSMFEQMPADMQMNHKYNITVLSDSLATFTDDYNLTMGGQKLKGRNAGLVVKREGQWKWKSFYEAGWGDYESPAVGGSGVPEDQKKPEYEEPKKWE